MIVCTGSASASKIPRLAKDLPLSFPQFHSSDYRRPEQIETGGVLVVGSGSSGIQICDDLARSGRFDRVYLATSGNFTLPWSVLGVRIGALARLLPVFDIERETVLGRWIHRRWRGRGDPAMAPSPRALEKSCGVLLRGRVTSVEQDDLLCSRGGTVPLTDLTVVWCTGFSPRFPEIQTMEGESAFDPDGVPRHHRGVSTVASGLYFLGLRFQHTVSSNLLHGVCRDAEFLAQTIAERIEKQSHIANPEAVL